MSTRFEEENTASLLQGTRVLVVDDSPTQRKRLRELYESMGMICVGEAAHGLECLNIVKQSMPDVISLDVIMPEMDGVETLGMLRKRLGFAGTIVFVSALGGSEVLGEVRSQGITADGCVSKQDGRDKFMRIFEQAIRLRKEALVAA